MQELVLKVLESGVPYTSMELAAETGLTCDTVNRLVRRLRADGYPIVRTRSLLDARVRPIRLEVLS